MKSLLSATQKIFVLALLCICTTALAQSPIIITPAPGKVAELSDFELRFDGSWCLGSNRSGKIKMTGPEGVYIPAIRNYSEQEYYRVYFENNYEITEPGEYTLTIPAGKFEINGVDCEETSFVYVIEEGQTPRPELPEYTVTPAPDVYKTIEGGFRFTFDTDQPIEVQAQKLSMIGPELEFTFNIDAPEGANYFDAIPVSEDGSIATLSQPGDYNLIIDSKAIHVGDATNRRPIILSYTITGNRVGNWNGQISATPESGSEVESLTEIKIRYKNAGVVKISDSATSSDFPKLYDEETDREVCGATCFATGGSLEVSLLTEITAPGKYYLLIPSKFVKVDGYFPTEDFRLYYTITDNRGDHGFLDYKCTFTPAPDSYIGVDETIYMTVEAEGLTLLEYDTYTWGDAAPHFTNDFYAYNPSLQVAQNGFTLAFSHLFPFEENGEYKLVIPSKYLTMYDADGYTTTNSTIEVVYNVGTTSIESITTDNEVTEIYNLTGIRLNTDINTLPKGIYLINGNKKLIK